MPAALDWDRGGLVQITSLQQHPHQRASHIPDRSPATVPAAPVCATASVTGLVGRARSGYRKGHRAISGEPPTPVMMSFRNRSPTARSLATEFSQTCLWETEQR